MVSRKMVRGFFWLGPRLAYTHDLESHGVRLGAQAHYADGWVSVVNRVPTSTKECMYSPRSCIVLYELGGKRL